VRVLTHAVAIVVQAGEVRSALPKEVSRLQRIASQIRSPTLLGKEEQKRVNSQGAQSALRSRSRFSAYS
jgi:hypothetical protein